MNATPRSFPLEKSWTQGFIGNLPRYNPLEYIWSRKLSIPTYILSFGTINTSTHKQQVIITMTSADIDKGIIKFEFSNKSTDDYYPLGTTVVMARSVSSYGMFSDWIDIPITIVAQTPTTPIITRAPEANNIQKGTAIKITATSTDPFGLPLTYIWDNRPAETYSNYDVGRQVVQVRSKNSSNLESSTAATIFFITDVSSGSGGMTLTGPDSYIYEYGIPGAYISSFTFTVPSVSGHSGSDYFRVKGYNVNTDTWDQVFYKTTSNGGTVSSTLPSSTYTQLEFYYYASHCMYGKSNITYSVEFVFGL